MTALIVVISLVGVQITNLVFNQIHSVTLSVTDNMFTIIIVDQIKNKIIVYLRNFTATVYTVSVWISFMYLLLYMYIVYIYICIDFYYINNQFSK